MSEKRPRITPGGFAPDFDLPSTAGRLRLHAAAGARPALLIFADTLAEPPHIDDADVFLVNRRSSAQNQTLANKTGVTVLSDTEGVVHEMFRAADNGGTAVVLGHGLRVVSIHHAALDEAVAALAKIPAPSSTAPLLVVDDVLEKKFCARLAELCESTEQDIVDPSMLRTLTAVLGRSIMPSVRRAFHFRGTGFERFRLAQLSTSPPQRWNLTAETAHRNFAITVFLNDGCTGGELRFPEYGQTTYCPAIGAAAVYSASVLSETTPVTAGTRFALQSYLFSRPRAV